MNKDELILGVCPCEFDKSPRKWKALCKEGYIRILLFSNWKEEEEKAEEASLPLYFVCPDLAYKLLQKGYKVLGRDKWQDERLVLLKRKNAEEKRLVIGRRKFMLFSLMRCGLDLTSFDILFASSTEEILQRLRENSADFGVIYKSSLSKISPKDKEALEVIQECPVTAHHFLMALPSVLEKHSEEITRLAQELNLVPVVKEEIELIRLINTQTDALMEFYHNRYIVEHLMGFPGTFVAIYRETFLFANQCAQELLGYTLEELKRLKPIEIVADEHRELVEPIIEKRLKGEKFKKVYSELKFKRKDGRHIYLLALSDTIIYRGSYAGLVFGVDITKTKRLENIRKIVKEVNQAILFSKTKEELFKVICDKLIDTLDLKLVWIGFPSKDRRYIVPTYYTGDAAAYIKKVKFPITPNAPKGPTAEAFLTGKVVINPNTLENPKMAPWREEAARLGLMSSAAIPIKQWKETIGVLNLYSSEPYYFEEEHKELLEELEVDLSIGLERISMIKGIELVGEAIERVKDAVFIADTNGKILYANPKARQMMEEHSCENIFELLHLPQENFCKEGLYHAFCSLRNSKGKFTRLEVDCHPVELSDGSRRLLITTKDITKEAVLSRELEELKYKDPTTGLLNSNAFTVNARRKLQETKKKAALIAIHIKGLPQVNYSYGFAAGDEVLKEAGRRISSAVMEKDLVARLDGSKFGVLITDIPSQEDLLKVLKRISDALEAPFTYMGKELHVTYSMGIATYPDDGEDFHTLYKNALAALHEAKRKEEKPSIEFFNQRLKSSLEQFNIASQLVKEAAEKGLFIFHYQPMYHAQTLEIAAFEALVRIKGREGKIHPPPEFIDYLENSKYNNQFQKWAIEEAVKAVKRWGKPISINVSGRSFLDDEFLGFIEKIPQEVAGKIILEITERTMLKDLEKSKRTMEAIKGHFMRKGVEPLKIAIDDFGTGYSSLLYLKELPADILKIDMQFVKEITKGERELGIVKIMAEMAHTLGMKAVAEGIETEKHLELIRKTPCDYLQGFFLSKPLPPDEIDRLKI